MYLVKFDWSVIQKGQAVNSSNDLLLAHDTFNLIQLNVDYNHKANYYTAEYFLFTQLRTSVSSDNTYLFYLQGTDSIVK